MSADLHSLATVTLLRRDELDATVAVLVVVPGDERCHPLTGLIFGGEGFAGVVRPVFHRAEQRFGVGVVVGDPWPGERPEHAQFFQPAFQRGCAHGVAVIGVQDQRLLSALADSLSQASPADQIRCNGWIFSLSNIPGHHFAAPDIDHQVEVEPDPAHGGGEIGDVPTPELVRSDSPEPWNGSRFLWWPCSTAAVHLAVGVEHPVEAAL